MLLPDSAVVAGCFTALNTTRGDERVRGRGPAATQIRNLLSQSGDEKSLDPGDSTLGRREDGIDAFLSFAQAYRHHLEDQHGRASGKIDDFITMRPESSFAYLLSAGNAEGQKNFDLADHADWGNARFVKTK